MKAFEEYWKGKCASCCIADCVDCKEMYIKTWKAALKWVLSQGWPAVSIEPIIEEELEEV